jgi:hypothetical protein
MARRPTSETRLKRLRQERAAQSPRAEPDENEGPRRSRSAKTTLCSAVTLATAKRGNQACIRPEEKVADREPPPVSDPPLCQVMRPVVEHVTALAEGAEVPQPVIGRVAVQMRGREHDACHSIPTCLDKVGPWGRAPAAIPPRRRLLVEPAPVRQATYESEVRPPAALARTSGALEANAPAQLTPVPRIERPQLTADGHGYAVGTSGQNA